MRVRRRPLSHGVALASLLLAACGGGVTERDQWTVWLTTDAPTPQLADRVLIDVLDDRGELACSDCRRPVGLPTDPTAWPISFGVASPGGSATFRVRVRLYRSERVGEDGLPTPATSLDVTAALPPARGNTEVGLVVRAECIGLASDLAARQTCTGPARLLVAETVLPGGKPDASIRPGTWPRAATAPCEGAPEGMVCLPGGFFVLGNAADAPGQDSPRRSPHDERFVTLSPFALDRDEITVGAVRRLVKAGKIALSPIVSDLTPKNVLCTYIGPDDPSHDAQSANCVPFELADQACRALGKRLPTEAEWEWAAGNLTEETRFPWGGLGGDPCALADVGLGRGVIDGSSFESTACRYRTGEAVRPSGLPPSANPADVTGLGVRRLAGGLAEWVAGYLAPYIAPCWQPDQPFLQDPRCDRSDDGLHVFRGSSWADPPGLVSSTGRQGVADEPRGDVYVGFRCAMSLGGARP